MKKLLAIIMCLLMGLTFAFGEGSLSFAEEVTQGPTYFANSLVKLEAYNYEGVKTAELMETNMGDLVTDAFRERTGADIALVQASELNSNILVGNVSYEDIYSILPDERNVSVVKISGYDIMDALEYAVMNYPSSSTNFLQVSGLTFDIQQTVYSSVTVATNGDFESVDKDYRVTNIKIGDKPLSLSSKYSVAATNEMFAGVTGFTMLTNYTAGDVVQENVGVDRNLLTSYISENLQGVIGTAYSKPAARIDAIKLARQSEIDKEIADKVALEISDMESITASLNAQIHNLEEIIDMKDMQIVVNSSFYVNNKVRKIKLTWVTTQDVEGVKYEIYRSVKGANTGYANKPYFTSKSKSYINSKGLTKGNTYYYKIRAVKYIDGQNYYSSWSNVTSKKITR